MHTLVSQNQVEHSSTFIYHLLDYFLNSQNCGAFFHFHTKIEMWITINVLYFKMKIEVIILEIRDKILMNKFNTINSLELCMSNVATCTIRIGIDRRHLPYINQTA